MQVNNRLYISPETVVVPVVGGYMMAMPGTGGGPGVGGGAPARFPESNW